ncbi:MAG: hypothetical protein FWF59_03915 [Turicibacter sp.]|nr:hypothetical protein [Turicibacter sp.]
MGSLWIPSFSRGLIEEGITEQLAVIRPEFSDHPPSSFLGIYRSQPLPFEEIMEMSSVSLTFETVARIFLSGGIIVLLSVAVPLLLLLRSSPKDILLGTG